MPDKREIKINEDLEIFSNLLKRGLNSRGRSRNFEKNIKTAEVNEELKRD